MIGVPVTDHPKHSHDRVKVLLSTLWIFAMLNYLYADVMSLMDPESLRQFMTGQIGSVHVTQGFLFGAAVLMETAIAMVLLSRILRYRANRLANIIAGALHTVAVLGSVFATGSLPKPYYFLFGTVEVACTSFIVWYAWRWRDVTPGGAVRSPAGR